MQGYFANFIRTGDPNGGDLPEWDAANQSKAVPVMHIDVQAKQLPEKNRERYLFLENSSKK